MNFDQYVNNSILKLSGNRDFKICHLIEYLQHKEGIIGLDLADCNISSKDVQILAKGNFSSLISLSLGRNKIGDKGAKALANLKNLTYLHLPDCNIGDQGAKALANLTNLTSLYLPDCNIGDQGAEALANLINLSYLELFNNNIGDQGAEALANLINLSYLNLSDNNIGDQGAKKLTKLKNLTSLALEGNKISSQVIQELSAKLNKLDSFDLLEVALVDFNKCVEGQVFSLKHREIDITELVNFLQSRVDITSLNLEDCNIDNKGARELSKLKNLTSLNLTDNRIDDKGARELSKLENLTHLTLEENNISPQAVKELLAKLKRIISFNSLSYSSSSKEPALGSITNQSAAMSHSNTLLNVEHKSITDKLNINLTSTSILEQENNTQGFSKLNKQENTTPNTQKKLPLVTASVLAVVGILSGIAIVVYLKMLAIGIIVGCCLVASATLYYCNYPSNSFENCQNPQLFHSSVQKLHENTQTSI